MQSEVLRRLHAGHWKPGELLPGEVALAAEFGCARSTVNRALQAIAEEGLLERRRRGGTRVVVHPARRATFDIPVIRRQIEQQGSVYGYRMLARRRERPPVGMRERMKPVAGIRLLHVVALHTADERAFVLEDRWIDVTVVPAAGDADFTRQSPNEWLVEKVPFNGGDLALSATAATLEEAATFGCKPGVALFTTERRTRNADLATITSVRLVYAPGYRMTVEL